MEVLPMKCIKFIIGDAHFIVRVPDESAEQLVEAGRANYASKEDWKQDGRHYHKGGDINGNS